MKSQSQSQINPSWTDSSSDSSSSSEHGMQHISSWTSSESERCVDEECCWGAGRTRKRDILFSIFMGLVASTITWLGMSLHNAHTEIDKLRAERARGKQAGLVEQVNEQVDEQV